MAPAGRDASALNGIRNKAHSNDKNLPFIDITCSWGMSCGNKCCTGAGVRSIEVDGNASCPNFEVFKKEEGERKHSVLTWPTSATCVT